MARMIDADVVIKRFRGWLESPHGENVYNSGYDDAIWHVLDVIEHMPTLTKPNEPLTCEGCIYEHNEHENCNYCKRAPYLGDYYYRRPPEGEEEENDVIEITENL